MPRMTPSGKKTAVADVEDKLKAEYPDNPGAVYGTLNKIGLMHGNQATAKGRAPAKFKEHRMRKGIAYLLVLAIGMSLAIPAYAVEPDIELIGKVRVKNGGTGGTTAAEARTNLGLGTIVCRMTGAGVAAGADTTEDTLATCTVPANAIGANGYLRVFASFTTSGAGGTRTPRLRYSGASGTVTAVLAAATTNTGVDLTSVIRNANATNSQIATGGFSSVGGAGGNGKNTLAVDTTVATTIAITCQKASAGDVCTLDQYLVELIADGA